MASIAEQTGQAIPSVTEGNDALSLFVGREKEIRQFSELLNNTPHENKILFYYGAGGNGKSLLMGKLRDVFCKSFSVETWQSIKDTLDNETFLETIKQTEPDLKTASAYIDFETDLKFQDPIQATLEIRSRLSKQGLIFPLYDYAVARYLNFTKKSDEEIKKLIPSEELNFFLEIIKLADEEIKNIPLMKTVYTLVEKHLGLGNLAKELKKLYKTGVSNAEYILSLDPYKELPKKLPELLAESISVAPLLSKEDIRIVLFFDAYEKLWGTEYIDKRKSDNDKWLKQLLIHLDCENGILPIIAGRTKPIWNDIPSEYLESVLIGNITRENACEYLSRAASKQECVLLADKNMQASLITYSQVSPQEKDEIHPLYLGLCSDVVIAATISGHEIEAKDFGLLPATHTKETVLLGQLLRYTDIHVEYATTIMSAPRIFDREIYQYLGKQFNFDTSEPNFKILTGFSFVKEIRNDDKNRYQIHGIIRKLLPKLSEEAHQNIIQAHQNLENYYKNKNILVEGLYHSNQIDWYKGLSDWNIAFRSNVTISRFDICAELLGLVPEMKIETVACQACVINALAYYHSCCSKYDDSKNAYLLAIEKHKSAITENKNDVMIHTNKALSHIGLGDIYGQLADHAKTKPQYVKALNSIDKALEIDSSYDEARISKVRILKKLGRLAEAMSDKPTADRYFRNAMDSLREIAQESPDTELKIIEGEILREQGNVEYFLGKDHSKAVSLFDDAHNIFDELYKANPNNKEILINKAISIHTLGKAKIEIANRNKRLTNLDFVNQTILSATRENSKQAFQEADEILIEAYKIAPQDLSIVKKQAHLAMDKAILILPYPKNLDGFEHAISLCDSVLNDFVNDFDCLNYKFQSLYNMADLHERFGNKELALQYYKKTYAEMKKIYSLSKHSYFKNHLMKPVEEKIKLLEKNI